MPALHLRIALLLHDVASNLRKRNHVGRALAIPAAATYRVWSLLVCGFDIPVSTKIGSGVKIYHGIGLVVSARASIGNYTILRQNTTIGETDAGVGAVIGRNVDVGANVVVLGGVHVGDGARIGAGAVVTKDVPAGTTVVGNPAHETAISRG